LVYSTIISGSENITALAENGGYNKNKVKRDGHPYSWLLERKIANAAAGLSPEYVTLLAKLPNDNALTVANYINSMMSEVNPSDHYRRGVIKTLSRFLMFLYSSNKKRNKGTIEITEIKREEILAFLDSYRRPESSDPLHKWIGTYNIYLMHLMRFFKWLYYPNIKPDERPKPQIIENISRLNRKEQSIYKPSDLWTAEEDLLFFKYCPSKRMKCYHAIARDLACRPHEILKLKIRDIAFKVVENRQYAEVVVNGKTGTRTLPLIDSIPYLKDYLNHEHPQPGNPNAVLICGIARSLGRAIGIVALAHIYRHYKTDLFPKLLESPNLPPEDKQKIRELLKKPWNPYLNGRHTSLTRKSKVLKEATLRVFAGWTTSSDMPQRYIHHFGNVACESILEAYGIVTKDKQLNDALKSKLCPNCSEPNKVDSKFCANCRMVLTYDAYSETLEKQQEKDSQISALVKKQEKFEQLIQTLIDSGQLKPNSTH
jgi:integrase